MLMNAVNDGDIARVRALYAEGCDVNARFNTGRTLVHLAAREGDHEMVRALHEMGADVNFRSKGGTTPAYEAAENGWGRVLVALHELGVDIGASEEMGDWQARGTIAHVLGAYGFSYAVRELYNIGIDVGVQDTAGYTPAGRAKAYGHLFAEAEIRQLVALQRWQRVRRHLCLLARRKSFKLDLEECRAVWLAHPSNAASFAAHVAADAAAYEEDVGDHLAPQEPCAAAEPAAKHARST